MRRSRNDWIVPQHEDFFDQITAEVAKRVNEDGPFELAVQVERDFRGLRYATITIRVLREPDGKRGIMAEQRYE